MTEEEMAELLALLLGGDVPLVQVGRIGPGDGVMQIGVEGLNSAFTCRPVPARTEFLLNKYLEGAK